MTIDAQLREASLATTLRFFVVYKHKHTTAKELYPDIVPIYGDVVPPVVFVQFGENELANPSNDPLGVYGDGKGNRQYIWRYQWYAEYPLHLGPLVQRFDEIGHIAKEMLTGGMTVPQVTVWKCLYRIREEDDNDTQATESETV